MFINLLGEHQIYFVDEAELKRFLYAIRSPHLLHISLVCGYIVIY